MAQDLATPFMQGLQIGVTMMQNLRETRRKEQADQAAKEIEQLKQQTELMKAQMDQQQKAATLGLQFVANEKIQAPQTKLKTTNGVLLPFFNSLLPADRQIQPLTEWNDQATSLVKAMQAVNDLPEEVGPRERLSAMAEQLTAFGLGEEALKAQQELAKPKTPDEQMFESLTPEQKAQAAAQKFTPEKNTQVISDVSIDDKGTKATIERDPTTGAWNIVKAGGKEVKGRSAAGGEGKISESERKAAVLATRLDAALKVLEALPDAAGKPGAWERMAQTVGAESLANYFRSDARQQANAAQLDALDAALTLATGAAYNKEQLQGLSVSYFPQLGDSPQTIVAKNKRFTLIVEAAKIAAGQAAPSVDRAQRPSLESFER